MRVLVTGDRGYLGAVMVPYLLSVGHEVVGLDAGWYDGCDFGAPFNDYEQRTGDVRDTTPADFAGFDAVVHLAAISNDPIGHLNPEATYSVNAGGAIHAATAAKAAGVGRFLFSSSCSLYGAAGEDELVDETGAVPPGDAIRREQGLRRARHRGPRRRRLLPDLPAQRNRVRVLDRACAPTSSSTTSPGRRSPEGEVELQSDGTPWRPLVHAEDIARAFAAVLEAPREVVHDEAFNVGRDEDVVQVRDIALAVSAVMDAPVTFAEGAGPDSRNYRVDFSKITRALPAFVPAWTVPRRDRRARPRHVRTGLVGRGLPGPALRTACPDPAAAGSRGDEH